MTGAAAADPAPEDAAAPDPRAAVGAYLDACRASVIEEIRAIVPPDTPRSGGLYALMLDYPLRHGKSLRPALAVAVCRALGGSLSAILPTAAVLELYHNAFLIHDDVEDGSDLRRAEPTLHRMHGVPTAVNVGDGMLAATIRPLLDNVGRIGLGRALRILRLVSRMSRESAEGQMMELAWIRAGDWALSDADYLRLVHKKTGWYSFIAPAIAGAVAAGLSAAEAERLGRVFVPLGVAFQIRDDLLNLASDGAAYGKDLNGDLQEGKRTLILIHALRTAGPKDRARALAILARAHPGLSRAPLTATVEALAASGDLTPAGRATLLAALAPAGAGHGFAPGGAGAGFAATGAGAGFAAGGAGAAPGVKTAEDVAFLRRLIDRQGSMAYAARIAERHADRFRRGLAAAFADRPRSLHSEFLENVGAFAVRRAD